MYKIEKKPNIIGTGQFGQVFVTHRQDDPTAKVAIKVLDKE